MIKVPNFQGEDRREGYVVRRGEREENGMACLILAEYHFVYTGNVYPSKKGRAMLVCSILHPVKGNTLKENTIQNLSGSYQVVAFSL